MDAPVVPIALGSVASCHRHPVKSMQGLVVDHLEVDRTGVDGDRSAGVVDVATGHLLTAKRVPELLWATGTDDAVVLPDGTTLGHDAPDVDQRLSAWLDRKVRLVHAGAQAGLAYEMTFDPPDDAVIAERYEEQFGPVRGGGYLNAATRRFLEAYEARHGRLPPEARRSWGADKGGNLSLF